MEEKSQRKKGIRDDLRDAKNDFSLTLFLYPCVSRDLKRKVSMKRRHERGKEMKREIREEMKRRDGRDTWTALGKRITSIPCDFKL